MVIIAKLPGKLHLLLGLSLSFLGLIQIHAQPQITIQSGHRGIIRCLALSADEKYLASAGADKTVIVWDIESEKKVVEFTGHENWIVALGFGPSSGTTLLASGDYDGTVKIWNLQAARLEQEITATRPYSIMSLDFSPDGEMLAIATGSKISVWNLKTRTMQVLEGHQGLVTKIYYGKDNYIFSSSLDRTLRIWNIVTDERKVTREPYRVASMISDPEKRLFAVAYANGRIKIRNTSEHKEEELEPSFPKLDISKGIGFREYRLPRFVKTALSSNAMIFLPNGKLAYNDGFKIRVWDYSSKVVQDVVDVESSNGSSSIVFSKKRNSIYYDDGEDVKAVELNSRKPHKLGNSFGANFDMLSLGLKGQVLLAAGINEASVQALIMKSNGGSHLSEYEAEALDPFAGEFPIEFTSSTDLISQGLRAEIRGRNIILRKDSNRRKKGKRANAVIRVLRGHHGNIKKFWTSKWNDFIVSSAEDSKIILWDVKAGKARRTFEGNPKAVRFSDDGTYLAIAEEEALKIWNLEDPNAPPADIKVDIHRVLVFSPDNRFIATEIIGGTRDDIVEPADDETNIDKLWASAVETLNRRPRILKIWDVNSGALLTSLPMQMAANIDYVSFPSTKVTLDPITYNLFGLIKPYISPSGPVSFSANGNLVAYDELDMFSGNSRIKVWNLSTNKEECVFGGHTSSIRRIIFSHDSKFVLSSGWDNILKIWSVTLRKLKATILTSKDGWVIFTPEGQFDTNLNLRKAKDVTWQWSQGTTRPLPLRVFLRNYYEPRLFRKILRDEPLSPVRDLASLNTTQPKVAIRDVQPDGPDSVKVTVEVDDVESDFQRDPQGRLLRSGVFDVRLLRNDQVVAQSTPDRSIDEFLTQIKPLGADPDRFERELEPWRKTHRVSLDASGKATLTFEHVKLPRNSVSKEIDFTVYAFNSDRVPSEFSPPFKYRLPASLPRTKPRAYILTIGVDPNESGWNLGFAAASANEVQKSITANVGKEYDVIKVSLLSTFVPESFRRALTQAKKENVRAVMDILAGRFVSPEKQRQLGNVANLKPASPDDLVFIYIASHGFSDPQGNFFIIPYDSGDFYGLTESNLSECIAGKAKTTSYSICDDGKNFIANSISSNELATWLQGVDAGRMYMILDSCYSAAAPGSNFKPGPLGDRTFGQLAYDKGMTILTASQRSAISHPKLNGTLLSRTLTELIKKKPGTSMLYLLEETEFTVPQNYQSLFPNDNTGIQYPVLFDFSATDN